MRAGVLWLLAAAACLPDFGLDERRFRCPPPCSGDLVCQEGFCIPPGEVPDALVVFDADFGDAMVVPFIDAGVDAAPGVEDCHDGSDNNGNSQVDCVDPACGIASCDDENVCTDESCLPNGACSLANVTRPCGGGCLCVGGAKTETSCMDTVDNDDDGLKDCRDLDCPSCGALGLGTCCPDGVCRLLTCVL